jgi:(1->4)-alpha-D-glucan 1-alpha-D-glucosylmutase
MNTSENGCSGGMSALDKLCALNGVSTAYNDIWGNRHETSNESKLALLAAMGLPIGDGAELDPLAEELEARDWRRLVPPVRVIVEGETVEVPLNLPAEPAERQLHWTLTLEDGGLRRGEIEPATLATLATRDIDGRQFIRRRFTFAEPLPLGYHQLEARAGEAVEQMRLIVTPARCFEPAALADDKRVWGLALQLYTVRSRRNWGIGDFSDLAGAVDYAATLGADLVGVNPLHAMFPHNPDHASPYSPSSRRFLNILYLDIGRIADFGECEAAREAVAAPEFQARLNTVRAGETVDYPAVAAAKLEILEHLFEYFKKHHLEAGSGRGREFTDFIERGGESLHQHALFEALQESLHKEDPAIWGWPVWPERYREPNAPAVASFAAERSGRVRFYQYLQWQAALQLEAVGERAGERGLGIGLYRDLALGGDRGGAETWIDQALYALDVHIGAPPDEYNPLGQDWGLPPPIPGRLAEDGYRAFIETMRRNMAGTGALRIDHVMSLMRLFWIPPSGKAADGAYICYPLHDLLGIVALESQRNRCLIIGEDLGTVPDEVRAALHDKGILSYRVLYFEKDADGAYQPPSAYPENALAVVATHDLPTLAGFWLGRDIDVRVELDLLPSEEAREDAIRLRATERAELLLALEHEDLLPSESAQPVAQPEMDAELAAAVHRFLARAPSKLMLVQMDDALGETEQVNLPGTTSTYPNWRRKLDVDLEDWPETPRTQVLAAALSEERGPRPGEDAQQTRLPAAGRIPRATYRLQLNQDFTFADAAEHVAYLAALGVSHAYASPYLKARPGSAHGYDIVDHRELNPEIGDQSEFDSFCRTLADHGMGHILDMVPNHMAVLGADNHWWLDVLENGQASPYAAFFDIDWTPVAVELTGKVLVPVLGDQYGNVLEAGELELVFEPAEGSFSVNYYEHRFPIDPADYPLILDHRRETLEARLGEDAPAVQEYQSLITSFEHLPARSATDAEARHERHRDKEIYKHRLAELCGRVADIAQFIAENVVIFNGQAGEPDGFDLLHALLERQAYRLAYWRVAADDINYRRFFDINALAGLRMENPEVFDATHALVLQLLAEGKLDGLRIDHPDGLYDPEGYFERLQDYFSAAAAGTEKPLYVAIEKILEPGESLPQAWRVHGTTGYEFANQTNGLFINSAAESALDGIYREFSGETASFATILYRSKQYMMTTALTSELNVLAMQVHRIALGDRRTRDFTLNGLRAALREVVARFPVYRTYVRGGESSASDCEYINKALAAARRRSEESDASLFDFLGEVLTVHRIQQAPALTERIIALAMRFQQYTAPVLAKGLEDTSFYRYNRLASLNEVGGDPRRFGASVAEFHQFNRERVRAWPHALLNTSTHDSKRSEDVRARIDVLSELADEWRTHLARWREWNLAHKRRMADGTLAPSANDEYLLYQTLLGVWPFGKPEQTAVDDVRERVKAYMQKAMREAKVHSSWLNPDEDYEAGMAEFIDALLTRMDSTPFMNDFIELARRIAHFGMLNSLSATLLKLTAPGVPNIYQGNELWMFSLVDPDNRRPVDFARRRALLEEVCAFDGLPADALAGKLGALLDQPEDGRLKLYLTWRALTLRRRDAELFQEGDYTPLEVSGAASAHLCAFSRCHNERTVIVLAPRLCAGLLTGATRWPLGEEVWRDTHVSIPGGHYRDTLSGASVRLGAGDRSADLAVADALGAFPAALLYRND